jgi:hypothetical protein
MMLPGASGKVTMVSPLAVSTVELSFDGAFCVAPEPVSGVHLKTSSEILANELQCRYGTAITLGLSVWLEKVQEKKTCINGDNYYHHGL